MAFPDHVMNITYDEFDKLGLQGHPAPLIPSDVNELESTIRDTVEDCMNIRSFLVDNLSDAENDRWKGLSRNEYFGLVKPLPHLLRMIMDSYARAGDALQVLQRETSALRSEVNTAIARARIEWSTIDSANQSRSRESADRDSHENSAKYLREQLAFMVAGDPNEAQVQSDLNWHEDKRDRSSWNADHYERTAQEADRQLGIIRTELSGLKERFEKLDQITANALEDSLDERLRDPKWWEVHKHIANVLGLLRDLAVSLTETLFEILQTVLEFLDKYKWWILGAVILIVVIVLAAKVAIAGLAIGAAWVSLVAAVKTVLLVFLIIEVSAELTQALYSLVLVVLRRMSWEEFTDQFVIDSAGALIQIALHKVELGKRIAGGLPFISGAPIEEAVGIGIDEGIGIGLEEGGDSTKDWGPLDSIFNIDTEFDEHDFLESVLEYEDNRFNVEEPSDFVIDPGFTPAPEQPPAVTDPGFTPATSEKVWIQQDAATIVEAQQSGSFDYIRIYSVESVTVVRPSPINSDSLAFDSLVDQFEEMTRTPTPRAFDCGPRASATSQSVAGRLAPMDWAPLDLEKELVNQ